LRKIRARIRFLAAALLGLLVASMAQADEDSPGKLAGDRKEVPRFYFELKREFTNRGTPEETSKTQIKIIAYLDGIVSLLRLEVPFPDEPTSFEGNPFNPHLGDIKVRVGFRPVRLDSVPLASFLEVTFPTANPEELCRGKYQVSPGIWTYVPISFGQRLPESHKMSFEPLVQQVVSVAGDENRTNINYTKFELSLRDTWRQKYFLKLTAKPIVDWEQGGNTGAVGELEGGLIINRRWRVWLLFGSRLWGGDGIPMTYDKRVGINASVTF
jgi:hypothetical protein